MRRDCSLAGALGLTCLSFLTLPGGGLTAPAWSQEPGRVSEDGKPAAQPHDADAGSPASIFNDQLRRFKFLIEHETVTMETAEAFIMRYKRPDQPRILGAYPDAQTNSLVVIGPPEAEQAIRECLAQNLADSGGLQSRSLAMQLRILQHERRDLLGVMAELEVEEIAAAAEENGASKAKQLAERRQMFEARLKIAEQQIRVVRKYMSRLEDEDPAAETGNPSAAAP
jgi:hypothetical protein